MWMIKLKRGWVLGSTCIPHTPVMASHILFLSWGNVNGWKWLWDKIHWFLCWYPVLVLCFFLFPLKNPLQDHSLVDKGRIIGNFSSGGYPIVLLGDFSEPSQRRLWGHPLSQYNQNNSTSFIYSLRRYFLNDYYMLVPSLSVCTCLCVCMWEDPVARENTERWVRMTQCRVTLGKVRGSSESLFYVVDPRSLDSLDVIFFLSKNIYLFIWLHQVLVAAGSLLSCGSPAAYFQHVGSLVVAGGLLSCGRQAP